ncbi:hypothetical protein [Leucobacter sp. USHLN153]|uniref:hypothetical protein n=1 Tax=Leucobacter sp. USHLN153 TaxID=3081268 RepID=UPI003018B79F
MSDVRISDQALSDASAFLVAARRDARQHLNSRPRGHFPSITGIGETISAFLEGLHTSADALSDAAHTADQALSALREEAAAIDSQLAGAVNAHPSGDRVGR